MSQGRKMLLEAVGLLLTIGLITFAVAMFNKGSNAAEQAGSKADKITQELMDGDKTKYDGNVVSGSDVLNAIKENKSAELSVWVLTKKTSSSGGVYYGYKLKVESGGKYSLDAASTALIADAKKITDNSYINPSADFLGSMIYDTNEAIIGIKFVQQ